MNLRNFKILIEVCNEMNMTKAANNLHMSQPNVSQCIKDMEIYYGIRIFERLSKRIYLTEEGKKILSYSNYFVTLDKELKEEINSFNTRKTYSVGSTVSVGTYIFPQLIRSFQQENPNILLKSKINNFEVIENMVINSEIDLAIVEGTELSDELIRIPLYNDELVIISSSDSPLLDKKLHLKDLNKAPFLIREEGSGARILFLSAMEQANIQINIIGEYNNTEAIINGVRQKLGLGVVSRLSVSSDDTSIKILNIPNLTLLRPYNLIYHKNKFISKELDKVINYLKRKDFISSYQNF